MATPPDTETFIYSRTPHGDLSLDVFRPADPAQYCAVLVFHGGGWRAGSKDLVHNRCRSLAAKGFLAVAVQYRLLDAAPWPAPLVDADAACGWIRGHAGMLDIDPNTLVVQGHSAGAHIALMTAGWSPDRRPAAIVAYYPPIGFHRVDSPPTQQAESAMPAIELDDVGRLPSWMLFEPITPSSELSAASPIDIVSPDFPPTIIFHGAADVAIDVRSSFALHQKLRDCKVPADLHIYADQNHEFDAAPSMADDTSSATASFLDRLVTNGKVRDEEARRFPFPPPVSQ